MTTTTRDSDLHAMANYLRSNGAHLIIGVTRLVMRYGEYRGKVNLGKAAGARGDNSRAARPVERAEKLGLVTSRRDGAAYVYNPTQLGAQVLNALDE